MNDCIDTKTLDGVLIQENGIIRDSDGKLIGRLIESVSFESIEGKIDPE